MVSNFSTSVNILRDSEKNFNYIPTPNANQVVGQIVNDFKKGIRSFNIIGTYGTGKSSFLLALEQSIRGNKRYFDPYFMTSPKVDFIKIVGAYSSIIEHFADLFEVSANKNKHENILSAIYNRYHSLGKGNKMLFIFLDEFGKFLEYASRNNPENELYFIQELAEFCNNPKHNIILISTVHQSFDSYAYSLTGTQKQEWTKVKGRFREITFNEPVEQLLFLASEHIADNHIHKTSKPVIDKCLKLVSATKAFDFNNDFLSEIASKLYPLDILSANILTLSLQRYGQNERSLFSFLESTDHTGLSKFNKRENPFYNLSCVYDYLNFNFYSYITSKYNPDFSSWSSIRSSIEEVERAFETNINAYVKAIKVIGLINIFSARGAILDKAFLVNYLEIACGLSNPQSSIEELEKKNVIRYRSHSKRFILFEGTDLDIQSALIEAGNKISEVGDITSHLNKYFHFTPVFAKLYSYKKGTPRFFEFVITEQPIENKIPVGEIDGYVNLVFNSKIKVSEIQEISLHQKEAVIYCFFKNTEEIKNILFEIEKIQKVIEENKEDKVAKRELESIVQAHINILNHYVKDKGIWGGTNKVKWFFKGEEKKIAHKRDFIKLLSQICSEVYDETPIFKNELVNKHRISSSIHTAKRNYFKALANNWDKENLGFAENKFPPEKTIYLTLLKENGISPIRESTYDIPTVNKRSSFNNLWKASEKFLNSAKSDQKKVSDFADTLRKRPFKLKQGLIDFWIPTYLFIRRDDFAIFNDDGYIPVISDDNLELIAKYPEKYYIKTFDIEGVKLDIFNSYRTFLNQSAELKFNNNSFIETIKPFIVFFKQLPDYTKNTKRLSDSALKIRTAISNSKDPEETFFVSFPNALGISLQALQKDKSKLQSYITSMQNAVRELRTCYDELIKRFESFICEEFVGTQVEFDEYKKHLQTRFSKLKKHLLLSNQKTFVQRIDSGLDDKKAWLNSIAQAVVGKSLENFSDEDEVMLYEKFKSMIMDLDSLTKISQTDLDENNEEIIGVKIDTFFSKINPKVVRVPKAKAAEIEKLKITLKKKLGPDNTSNIAAVLNLLKELLQ